MMNIKNMIATSLAALITVNLTFADTPMITSVMAQLENPWDGKVYISYKVTGDIAATAKERGLVTSLKVTATDSDANKTYTATALSGDMGLTAGSHSLVWDMSEESFCLKSTNVVFRVSYEKVPALYCVVDLSAGSSAASYPVTYLSEPPSGGFNTDEYKTTKLVLRRIEQGTYKMQDTSNVTLTKPFYIGIFEMTQKQYQMVAGNNPSYYKGDKRPVENVNYNTIRGSSNGAKWPSSSTVDSSSFLGKFQARTGLAFDLPTESQWECACRAGMTSSYNNGGWAKGDLNTLGRYSGNVSDGKGGYSGTHTTVGSYAANAWGFYDMHGNAMEWCLDWFDTRTYGTDPKGPSSGSSRVAKGGTWWRDASGCTSSSRYKRSPADTNHEAGYGFRIARTMSNVETSGSICSGVGEPMTVNLTRSKPWDFSENLVAHYEFDGNATDTSGNGNDGVLYDVTSITDRHGNIDSAYHFNGTSAYIEVPDSDSLREVGQTVTLSAWIKPEAWFADKWLCVFCKGDDNAWQYGIQLNKVNKDDNIWSDRVNATKSVTLNEWSHLVMIYSPIQITAYLNGEELGSVPSKSSIKENSCSIYIGFDPPGGDEYLTGDMDEVRIYNRALSTSEVRALANGDRPVASEVSEEAWVYRYDVVGGIGITQTSLGQLSANFEIPDTIDGKSVIAIGRYGFANNGDIQTVTIPASVAEIGGFAFAGCANLGRVMLPTEIGTLTIGGNAFDAMTKVEIAAREGYVFAGWTNSIGVAVMDPFHRAESVTVTPTWKKIKVATIDGHTWTYTVSGNGFATIGNGVDVAVNPVPTGDLVIPLEIDGHPVVEICGYAFADCDDLTSLTIPSGITNVGVGAFDGCSGLTNLVIDSEELYTPGLLQAKFDTRFDTASTLGDVSNPIALVTGAIAAYTKVESSPWEFPDPLTGKVYAWNESNTTFAYWGQIHLEGGKTYIFGTLFDDDAYMNVDEHVLVNVPYHDDYITTVYNGSYACASNGWYSVDFRFSDSAGGKGSWGNIWSSDFGAGYRDDGSTDTAQSGWSRLLDPGDGSLFRFKGMSFAGCSNLVSVTMPVSLVTTMAAAFPDAYDKLESVTLTGGLAAIPEKAFAGCASLTSVAIPAETTGIGAGAFSGCAGLATITLPKEIGTLALGANVCDAATSVEMDPVDGYFFGGWTNATGVIISDPFYSSTAVTVSPRWMIEGTEYDEHLIFFEDFERESMEFDLSTVGTFPYPACIQDGMGVDGSRGFGFGRSSCHGDAWDNYVNTLIATFNARYFITRVEFDEMERYGNYGSAGEIIVNYGKNQSVIAEFCQIGVPHNDGIADTEYKHREIEIGIMATNISFQVGDITDVSEEFIDNVKIYGRLARQCTVTMAANDGTGTVADQTVLEGDDLVLAANAFVRTGYLFLGWSVSAYGDVVYEDRATIPNVSADADGAVLYAVWKPCAPGIYPAEDKIFINASQTVSLSHDSESVLLLYTTDGRDPKADGLEYKGPFAVYGSCGIRAVAYGAGRYSEDATVTLTRNDNLGEAANCYGYLMETGGDTPWVVDGEVSHDGVSSVRSGAIGNNGTTYLQVSVRKAGTVSFWWRAMCEDAEEDGDEMYYYDYGAFSVDGEVKARIAGRDTGWQFVSVDVPTGGKHTLRWEYAKDGSTTYSPDCVWLDQVQWVPADGSGFTLTTPVPVPYSWLAGYGLGVAEGDFEAAANDANGKIGNAGKPLSVWQDYVAGTDPTDTLSRLTAKIEMRGNDPVVTWDPNLNTNGIIRIYKVWGKENLTDWDWVYPTNALHRFFKVTVEMP